MATSALKLRLEAQAAYEDYLLDEFRHYPDAVELYRHQFRNTPFASLYKRRRALLRPELWPMLHAAGALPKLFVRDPMDWKARGHSVPTLLWSLVQHLYCRYPMPYFWLAEWMREPEDVSMTRLRAFARIGQGQSVYFLSREGTLGVHLSLKECHVLGRAYGVWGLGAALRMAQVLARGGTRRLGLALGQAWGEWPSSPRIERRRSELVTWLIGQSPVSSRDLDFVVRAVDAFPRLRFAGRTVASLRAHVGDCPVPTPQVADAPRRTGRHVPPPTPGRWDPSGLQPMIFPRGRASGAVIRELNTLTAVHHEGARLSHCVASYAASAARGQCSLWSLRIGGISQLTIEVSGRAVRQVRGKHNRAPTASELRLVKKWAQHNQLWADDC